MATLTPLFALQSCSLDEPVDMHNENAEINLIFRSTSYNKVNASTKSGTSTSSIFAIEDAIYSAYLLVFDKNGSRVYMERLTVDDSSVNNKTIKADKALKQATVCLIANVPQSFINKWSKVITGESYSSDLNKFLNSEIDFSSSDSGFSFAEYSDSTPCVGIPQVVIDDEFKNKTIKNI